jgi:hypothetical protein
VVELGRREDPVVLGDPKHATGEALARDGDVMLEVDDALRLAGRAGAVQPERHVVAMRRRRIELVDLRRQRTVELHHPVAAARDERHLFASERRAQRLDARRIAHNDAGVGVGDVVAVVVGSVERAHRNRDRAEPDRAEERDREDGGVVEDQQHALLASDAELTQQVPEAIDLAAKVLVAQGRVGRDVGRLVAPSFVDISVEDLAGVVGVGC